MTDAAVADNRDVLAAQQRKRPRKIPAACAALDVVR
jgi:hypothetical protein